MHIVLLFLNALLLVPLQVQVLCLSLGIPKFLEVLLSVLFHLYFILLAFVFEAIVDFSRYSDS